MAYNIYTNHFYGSERVQLPRTENKKTTDKTLIQKWAEARRGIPVYIPDVHQEAGGKLRICFKITHNQHMQRHVISWEKFFQLFDEQQLALIYQENKYNGDRSIYCELVNRY